MQLYVVGLEWDLCGLGSPARRRHLYKGHLDILRHIGEDYCKLKDMYREGDTSLAIEAFSKIGEFDEFAQVGYRTGETGIFVNRPRFCLHRKLGMRGVGILPHIGTIEQVFKYGPVTVWQTMASLFRYYTAYIVDHFEASRIEGLDIKKFDIKGPGSLHVFAAQGNSLRDYVERGGYIKPEWMLDMPLPRHLSLLESFSHIEEQTRMLRLRTEAYNGRKAGVRCCVVEEYTYNRRHLWKGYLRRLRIMHFKCCTKHDEY